jgi:hypothetical protein
LKGGTRVAVAVGLALAGAGCALPAATAERPIAGADGVLAGDSRATSCRGGGDQPGVRVIGTSEALRSQLDALGIDAVTAGAIAAWPVAWGRGESLVVVQGGAQPNPGYGIVVERIGRTTAGGPRVEARVDAPPRGVLQPQVIAHPCVVVRVGGLPSGAADAELSLAPAR